MSQYQAGQCNIGPSEIHRRYQTALFAVAVYLLLAITFVATDQSQKLRLIAFIPAMGASVGYVQARRRFCLAYGFAGLFNFDRAGDVKKVIDKEALAADRSYAIKIFLISLLPAIVMTAVVYFL